MRYALLWLLVSLDLRLLINKQWIFSKVVKISDFWILSGWIEKYKPALSKSDSSWINSCFVRLVIVSLAVNIGKLQSHVSEDNFFCWVYYDFCNDFLLYNLIRSFLIKLNMINCILQALLLLAYMVLLKCTNSPLVIHFLNFIGLFGQ